MFRANFWTVRVLFVITLCTLVLLAGSLVLAFYGIDAIITSLIKKNVELKEGTEQWDRFIELPPLDFKVWFWNVENAQDIVENGATPQLKEVGPYIFSEIITKNDTEFNTEEDSVSYNRKFIIDFDKTLSGDLTMNDTVTIPNAAMISVLQMATSIERLVVGGCLDTIFPEELNKMFITVQVYSFLMEGIVFAKNENVGTACGIVRKRLIELSKTIKVIDRLDIDGNILDDDAEFSKIYSLRLALFRYKTERSDGRFTVNRGMVNVSSLGTIMRWNGKEDLDIWGTSASVNNDTCKRIRGTDSTIYAPGISSEHTMEVFNTDVCRVVSIQYTGTDTYNGISGYRFEAGENTFYYDTTYAENDCFCTKLSSDVNGNPSCFLDGVLDLRPCIGAPVLVSFPHFLHAPNYVDKVLGMAPDVEKHRITLLLEPNTGSPLEGRERIQMNLVLKPELFISMTTNLPRVVIPLLWIEEGLSLPQKYVDLLNNQYFGPLKIATGFKYGFIAASTASLAVSLAFLIRKKVLSSRHKNYS